MKGIELFFWIGLFIVFYTYIGYGILLWILVKIKEIFKKRIIPELPKDLPEVTLLIAAYNEEAIVDEKMNNCKKLSYPTEKLKIYWITDGSTDQTDQLLAKYPEVTVLHENARKGKTAALNRGIQFVTTPLVVFTDANTMLNEEAITEIVRQFTNPKVGCVAGEKRILKETTGSATAGEGIYWVYESFLKQLDSRLYSAVGAAGELFAIRSKLFEVMPEDTLLDDFILSLRIAQKGYKIAYCKEAYAIENTSADMKEEEKRKVRISAGGIQSIYRLSSLLNIFRFKTLSFQYISHRVLRWSVTPILLFLLFPANLILMLNNPHSLYGVLFILQCLFYSLGMIGYYLAQKQIRNKILFVPYYFLFMNINVIKGFFYLKKKKGSGTWEKARRA